MFIHTPITAENLPTVTPGSRLKGLDVFDTRVSVLYRLQIDLVDTLASNSPVTLSIHCKQSGVSPVVYAGQSAIDFWIGLIPVVQEISEDTANEMSRWAEDASKAHREYKSRPFDVPVNTQGLGAII